MCKHISIHKAEFHKAFNINEEQEEIADRILFVEKIVYPIEDIDYYYLYDVEGEEVISKSKEIETFKIGLNTEVLSLIGVPLEKASKLNIPKNVKHLIFERGESVPFNLGESQKGFTVWQRVINLLNLYKLVDNIVERLILEDDLRNLYNKELPQYITDFGLSKFLEMIDNSSIVKLTIAFVYFTDFDFKAISKLKKLQELEVLYSYNDNIRDLPKNISRLKIYGHTIQKLSELNLNLENLHELELDGNTINNLDNLSKLPKHLEDLILSNNRIKNFNINELPANIDFLDLGKNLIENDFFNQKTLHKNLRFLLLKENKIVVTASVLNQILKIFPSLEHLELLGNETDGVPIEFLGDSEHPNCLKKVQFFLDGIDFKHNGKELKLSNSKDLNHFIEVAWYDKLIPLKVILGDIQYFFSPYFERMPFFYQYGNGIYCFIEHDNCELFIIVDEETKKIDLRIQSDKPEMVSKYFHKYFNEVQNIMCFNSHINVLPFISYSESCDYIKEFHYKVFKLGYKIKSNYVLKPIHRNIELLVNNRLIEEPEQNGIDGVKLFGTYYYDIKNIGFILVTGKSAFPFVLEKGVLTNLSATNNTYYYNLTLRDSSEKERYIKGITNKYLNASALVEAEVFIDNNVTKKVSCFINPNYFHANNKILSLVNPKFPELKEGYLTDVKMDNNKWCEFNIEYNSVELKYVL